MAALVVRPEDLIEHPLGLRPQVVLLGAGASCAAFPKGEPGGRRLPQMCDFIDVVGLRSVLEREAPGLLGNGAAENFEVIYSALSESAQHTELCRRVEQEVRLYFAAMRLPDTATLYDRLVLALRPEDTIFTFNWDPFLFDAVERNRRVLPSPRVHYLHGCVRVAKCLAHADQVGIDGTRCPKCGNVMQDTPLLYPVEKKDYASDPFIASEWAVASEAFANGMILTIFGYGAPTSDEEAKQRLKTAWTALSKREIEHVEVIDKPNADVEVLEKRWRAFTPTHHFRFIDDFGVSHIARWPRRASESWFYPMTEGRPCMDFPLPETNDLGAVQDYCRHIAAFEGHDSSSTA